MEQHKKRYHNVIFFKCKVLGCSVQFNANMGQKDFRIHLWRVHKIDLHKMQSETNWSEHPLL